MQDDSQQTRQITGLVKWFDPIKGFGFVVSDEGGSDILLHINVLRNFGQSSIADFARVVVEVQDTERGVQAVEVISIAPPDEAAEGPVLDDPSEFDVSLVADAPLEAGRVKWFDKGKGFGFANVFGRAEDVFLHIEILRRSGLAELQPGEALALKVVDGKRGRMAAEVHAWEAALSKD